MKLLSTLYRSVVWVLFTTILLLFLPALSCVSVKLTFYVFVMATCHWINLPLIVSFCGLIAFVYGCGDGERPHGLISQVLDSDFVAYGTIVDHQDVGVSSPDVYTAVMELNCTLKGGDLPLPIRVLAGKICRPFIQTESARHKKVQSLHVTCNCLQYKN